MIIKEARAHFLFPARIQVAGLVPELAFQRKPAILFVIHRGQYRPFPTAGNPVAFLFSWRYAVAVRFVSDIATQAAIIPGTGRNDRQAC